MHSYENRNKKVKGENALYSERTRTKKRNRSLSRRFNVAPLNTEDYSSHLISFKNIYLTKARIKRRTGQTRNMISFDVTGTLNNKGKTLFKL